jgi:hypothetical protein
MKTYLLNYRKNKKIERINKMNKKEKKRRMQEMRDASLTDHIVVGVDDIRLHASEDENGALVPYLYVYLDTENIVGIFTIDSPYRKSKLRDIIESLELMEEVET